MNNKKQTRMESAVTRHCKPQGDNQRNSETQPQSASSNEIISINKLKTHANQAQSRNQVAV